MVAIIRLLLIVLMLSTILNAYESENKLKSIIVGKIAKYISWDKKIPKKFIITVLNNNFGTLFDDTYLNKKIKSKPVEIKYINHIYQLGDSEILFISKENNHLDEILNYIKHKNILSISDKRGFAQKGGILQLYFVERRLKLRINIDALQENGFKVDRTLLKIVDVVKRSN